MFGRIQDQVQLQIAILLIVDKSSRNKTPAGSVACGRLFNLEPLRAQVVGQESVTMAGTNVAIVVVVEVGVPATNHVLVGFAQSIPVRPIMIG